MNLTKLFSQSAFSILLTTSLVACDTAENVSTGVDATGQPEENIALADETIVEDETIAQAEDATGQSEVEGAVEDEMSQAEENVTTEDVSENTNELLGQTVTIRSDALEVIEPTTFVISDQEFFGGEDIVVVNATGEVFELPEDDIEVQITGKLTKFVQANIESVYDLDLNPDLYVDYADRPAVIAKSLALAPDPGEIAEDPTQFYGKTLAVTGEVEDVYSANTFTLDEDELFGGEDLLVVVPNLSEVITEDETVAVTGELRSFVVTDLETDYDLTWDLDVQEQLEVEYTERPVLVVDHLLLSV